MARTHTVKRGDTLSELAQRFYQEPGLFGFIAAVNGIADPNVINIGQILTLPDLPRVHRVVAGDTLSEIAVAAYGDAGRAADIAAANAIHDPDHIEVGWVLALPDLPVDPPPVAPKARPNGTMPYASEPFGVYQPLIGWRSNLQTERVRAGMVNRFQQAVRLAHLDQQPAAGPHLASNRFADITGTSVGRQLVARAEAMPAGADVWQSLLADADDSPVIAMLAPAQDVAAAPALLAAPQVSDREAVTARLLQQLTKADPSIADQLFAREVQPWERALAGVQFIAETHPSKAMFLSPIGILHRFREYFFELGTFLGPPVGHVWISPGGTVELVEVNTRARSSSAPWSSPRRRPRSPRSPRPRCSDDIADAVKAENANDMKLGVTTSASGGLGSVFQASASGSFNLDSSRKQAQEQTHKRMREQTSKLSSESSRTSRPPSGRDRDDRHVEPAVRPAEHHGPPSQL